MNLLFHYLFKIYIYIYITRWLLLKDIFYNSFTATTAIAFIFARTNITKYNKISGIFNEKN